MNTKKILPGLAFVMLLVSLVGASSAFADDCATLTGVLESGECRIKAPVTLPTGGSFSIATPVRITPSGSIVLGNAAGAQTNFSLSVAGNFTIDMPATGGFSISGNGSTVAPSIGAAVSIVASGDIFFDGDGSTTGAQIRVNNGISGTLACASTNRAGSITLMSTGGHVRLAGGSKLFTTGGCLGGEMTIRTPVGNVEIGGQLLSQGVVSSNSTALPVRGGPITVAAAGDLMVTGSGAVKSQGSVIGPLIGTKFNYGADRVHLESGGDMTINGLVQSVGGFSFGPDILGGINRCTGASRVGKPSTPTGCVELWVGGTFTANGGDPRDPTNGNNGYINARSGDQAQANGTCCTWIDVFATGDVRLKGQPSGVSTNGFLIDTQQASNNATGGTIHLLSLKGKVTASGRTFLADAATAGGTGGTVKVEASGPVEYPPLPPGQFHPADLRSNVDLGDSLQFARGANTGSVGGAGTMFIKSFNGQITGGPLDVLAPGTSVTLPAGTVLCAIGIVCDLQIPPLPTILATPTQVTLPDTTFFTQATATTVNLATGTRVTLPGGLVSILWRDAQITAPAGKATNPSLTPLAGGCTDRFTGAALPNAAQQYPCNEFNGTVNAGGIGSTQLIVTLCEGWLYNGVTVPLTTTFSPQCGGTPDLPPDVKIPIAPTIVIFGGVYQYDGLERPATGDQTNGQFTGVSPRVAVVPPTAYGETGPAETLLPLPTVTYVDSTGTPVAVPIQVGTYTATALFPGCSPTTTPCGPAGTPQAAKTYTGLITSAPIMIFSSQSAPQVTVVGGVYRFDGAPHPATGVTTTDASTGAAITAPPTTVYYNCTWTQPAPPPTAARLVAGPAAFGAGCTTTPPVNTTTTKINTPLGTVNAVADGVPVVAYFPGNVTYGPALATAGIAIWRPRPSVTTATGGTFVYDGNPHATTTAVRDGGTDGLSGTYPTAQATVDPATWTFTDPGTGTTQPSGVTYDGTTTPLHAVGVQAPVNVGTYPVTAVYPGDAVHSGSTGTNTIKITPRAGSITTLGGTFLCDDNAHGATGSITSTNAAGQTVNLGAPAFTYQDSGGTVLAGPPTAPGTYTVTASLPQTLGGNYSASATTATITINPKTATVTIAGGATFVWDGSPHPATGTVTGTGVPAGTAAVIAYSKNGVPTGVPTDVGVYTAVATAPALGSCFVSTPATTTITILAQSCTPLTGGNFTFSTLAYPASGVETAAHGITGTGEITGAYVDGNSTARGFWLSAPGGSYSAPITTAALGGVSTTVYGNNAKGHMVGTYLDGIGRAHGFLVTGATAGTGGTQTPIDVPGALHTMVYGVNDSGQIVGAWVDGGAVMHGFILTGITFTTPSGVPDLSTAVFTSVDATVPGATGTAFYGISGNGQIVGAYLDASGAEQGLSATFGAANFPDVTAATFTPVNAPGAVETRAYGVNDGGQIVGSYDDAAGIQHGFKFAGNTFTTLDVGTRGTVAYGINNASQVVGGYTSPTGDCGFVTATGCKTFTIGPSSMEGAIKLSPGDWVSGGYSFSPNFATAAMFTVTAKVTITGSCIGGTMPTDTFTVDLGSRTYSVPAGSPGWLPTGDQGNVLSWMAASRVPATICGGNGAKLDGSKGAVFTSTIAASPDQAGRNISFRFHYRDPFAKGKPNTNCTDTTDPNRSVAAVCGASWSETVTTTADCPSSVFTTYTQGGWGAKPTGSNPGALLKAKFSTVYPTGSVSIGGLKTLTFTSAAAIEAFLPQGGTAAVLTASATNPTSSAAKVIGGQLLALRLSVDFSNAGITRTGLANLQAVSGPLVGYTVAQILSLANIVVGGQASALPPGVTVSNLNDVLNSINNNFDNGTTNTGYLK